MYRKWVEPSKCDAFEHVELVGRAAAMITMQSSLLLLLIAPEETDSLLP